MPHNTLAAISKSEHASHHR